jgi:uroporphyrin-3 C-methyltransferase
MIDSPAAQPATAGNGPEASRAPPRGRLSSYTALVFSLLALIACGYLGYTFNQKRGVYRADMFSRLDKLETATADLNATTADQRAHLDELHTVQDSLVTSLGKIEAAGANRLDAVRLAEAEQLLVIANHRLQLARDVKLSLAALRAADRQLALIARPAYLPVRREIAAGIQALEARAQTDVPGLALKLAEHARTLDRLPFVPGAVVAAATGKQGDTRGAVSDLLSLVRIRSGEDIARPLLPPDRAYFLRENLRLVLLAAQAALLGGEIAVCRDNLQTARDWLRVNFDIQNQAARALDSDLKAILDAPIGDPLPDLSRPLDLLRTLAAQKPVA